MIKRFFELLNNSIILSITLLKRSLKIGIHKAFIEFCDNNSTYANNRNYVELKNFGNLNSEKFFGLIQFETDWVRSCGFFALFNKVLGGLYFLDKFSLIPCIHNWDECAYEEKNPVNGSTNVFEYYFSPLNKYSEKDVLNSKNVILIKDSNTYLVKDKNKLEWYNANDKYIEDLAVIYAKYIKFNSETSKKLDLDIATLGLTSKTLGVHYRGTDYNLNCIGHPKNNSMNDFAIKIEELIKKDGYNAVFLATDDLNALSFFKEKFANIIYYNDVKRASEKKSVAFDSSDSPNSHYRLGYEVIRDMYTLSKCNGLLAGNSQVSIAARICKTSRKEKYLSEYIIDTGINRTGPEFMDIFYGKYKMKRG